MTLTDIGAKIKEVTGITPTTLPAAATTTTNGDAINRDGFLSAVVLFNCGLMSTTGTFVADAKLQQSADGSTGWTDVVALPQLAGDQTADVKVSVDVNLKPVQKFLRVTSTVTLTGAGATMPIAATVILGGAIETPV